MGGLAACDLPFPVGLVAVTYSHGEVCTFITPVVFVVYATTTVKGVILAMERIHDVRVGVRKNARAVLDPSNIKAVLVPRRVDLVRVVADRVV